MNTEETEIGRKSPGSLAPRFLGMNIVLETARCSGSLPHQRIRLHILVRTPGGMALSWRAVRPSGPGDTARNGLAALIFSGVIGCQTSSMGGRWTQRTFNCTQTTSV